MTRLASIALVTGLLFAGVTGTTAQQTPQADKALAAANHKATVAGDLRGAIDDYKRIVESAGANRALAAESLLRMAECHQKLGETEEAQAIYARIVRDFADETAAMTQARAHLAALSSARTTNAASRSGLTCTDCVDAQASVSRDGRWIVMTDWSSGDLAIRDLATGQTRRLLLKTGSMNGDGYAYAPVFSPDASQVAFLWDPETTPHQAQLRVVENRPGATARVLVDSPEFPWPAPLAWSRDGSQLLAEFEKPDRTWQLAWISVADQRLTVLKSLNWRVVNASTRARLSPDGRFIAYYALAATDAPRPPDRPSGETRDVSEQNIYVLGADGGSEIEVTRTAGIEKQPLWSPDGRHLLFQRDHAGTWDLWALPMHDGTPSGSPAIVRRDVGRGWNLSITDAAVYYYARAITGLRQISIAELDTTGALPARVRTVDSFPGINPSWSPDGTRVGFSVSEPLDDGSFRNVVRTLSDGGEARLSYTGLRQGPPRWMPGGSTYLQLVRRPTGAPGAVVAVDVAGRTFREVIHPVAGRSGVSALSPDGRTLYRFARDTATEEASVPFTHIVAIDIATARERVVARLPGAPDQLPGPGGMALAVSGDGRKLAIVTGRQPDSHTLAVLDVDGSSFRTLHGPYPSSAVADRLSWTRDNRALLFSAGTGVTSQVMRINIDGGAPEFTGFEARALGPFSISPDGRRIAFSHQSENQSELWAFDLSRLLTGVR